MIEDGLCGVFRGSCLPMHNGPGYRRKWQQCPESARAGAFFDVDIQGKGGHGAYPHLADPIP